METAQKPKSRRLLIVGLLAGGLLVLASGTAAGFWFARQHAGSSAATSDAAKKQEIVREVGAMYLLPAGEDPTVAIIQDRSALGAEIFFKNAQNGDAVIVYKTAGLGLIYRQSLHKLVNVQTVSLAQPAGGTTPAGN